MNSERLLIHLRMLNTKVTWKVHPFYLQFFYYSSPGDSGFTLKKRKPVRQPVVQDDY